MVRESKCAFRFENPRYRGLGTLGIRMPVSHSQFLRFKAEVLGVNVPSLLGLETLTHVKVTIDFGSDRLVGKYDS